MAEHAYSQDWTQGYLQVYTGNGKGKSTAAFGMALRAAGAGLHTWIAQFVKGQEYAELEGFKHLAKWVTIKQYGTPAFITGAPTEEDRAKARAGLAETEARMTSGRYRLVILDEANVAIQLGLFTVEELLAMLDRKPAAVEVVVTGRNVHPRLAERADLVTVMHDVKHYYEQGVMARRGIDT